MVTPVMTARATSSRDQVALVPPTAALDQLGLHLRVLGPSSRRRRDPARAAAEAGVQQSLVGGLVGRGRGRRAPPGPRAQSAACPAGCSGRSAPGLKSLGSLGGVRHRCFLLR